MSQQLLVGMDVGTTGLKTVLFDSAGNLVAQASREYPTAYPRPGWAEQDPQDWWQAACETLNQALAAAGKAGLNQVAGVGVSCQAPTLLAVNEQGNPLFPAMIWMDRRAEAQCDWLREQVDEAQITRTNGGRVDPYYLGPKLLWFKQNQPDLYRRTHTFLQANGYIVARLTGQFCLDNSHAPLTLFYDSRRGTWSEQLLSTMGLEAEKLPPILPCAQVAGQVTPAAARSTGLPAGIPVIAGMTDGTAAALEAGVAQVGDAVEMSGQSSVVIVCSDQPYLGRDLIPLGHALPGKYLVVAAMVASGGALRWFRDQLGSLECQAAEALGVDPFELLSLQAAKSPPGANKLVFLPYMFGERSPIWDSQARGVFFGLSLATKKADMIRAIMEGAAYGLRHNMESMRAGGFGARHLSCVGGGSRSPLWNQIKADVLNQTVRLPQAATGAPFGDAILVAVSAGLYASVETAVEQFVQVRQVFQPDPARADCYDRFYRVYRQLYPALKANFKELAAIGDLG